jgi:hypothetical protein
MKPPWIEAAAALLLAAGCVSYDVAGPPVPNITGSFAASVTLSLSNQFEVRNDTLEAVLQLRDTGERGLFTGTYVFAPSDSGAVDGSVAADGTLILSAFGPPPKPIAGVAPFRRLYPWCDWALLGMPPVRGRLAGDTLRASVQGSVPCFYQVNGTTEYVHTQFGFTLTAVR